MALTLTVAAHPLLEVGAFATRYAQSVAQLPPVTAPEPPQIVSDPERSAVRDLLRHGGFKPSGRSKPASEYLLTAHAENRFPRINAAVDACNIASLHWGLPISLIDLDRVVGQLSIQICPPGTSYVFNPSGQTIDASGLLAVFDREGPTGTPVKDAQRTKTHDGTLYTLAVLWGTNNLPGRTEAATRWYRDLVASIPGTMNESVEIVKL
jgi:DNA/RNA-binding domain of Phe-tRNA-synthetase-like protein